MLCANHRGTSLPTLALAVALALSTMGLAACNSPEKAQGSSSVGSGSGSAQVAGPVEEEPELRDEAAIEAYRKVLADVGSLPPFMGEESPSSPTGAYQYSIVTLQPGEGPSMLLGQEWSDGFLLVRVYYFDQESSTMHVTENDYLISGTAMYGGYRGGMGLAADGNGLVQTDLESGNGTVYYTRYNRVDDDLVAGEQATYSLVTESGTRIDSVDIEWCDSTDTSILDAWEASEAEAETDEVQETEAEEESAAAEEEQEAVLDCSGRYRPTDGLPDYVVTDHLDGTLTMVDDYGEVIEWVYDSGYGDYVPTLGTAHVYFVTDTTPWEMHWIAADERVYYKVD